MKNPIKFAVPAVLGGIAAFVLRRLQTAFGFETDTGLPVKSSPYGLALLLVLAVLAVVFALMVRRLPADREQPPVLFSQRFCSAETFPFFLLIAGLLLIVLSGALDLLAGLTDTSVMQDALSAGSVSGGISTATSSLSPRLSVVQGVLTICAGICLFPVCKLCRRRGKRVSSPENPSSFSGNLLLVPVIVLVIRLVVTYRADSVNPSLSAYYVELLALTFLILSLFRMASFAFDGGKPRRYVWDTLAAVVLCAATLADGHGLASGLLYGGAALAELAFLLLYLDAPLVPAD